MAHSSRRVARRLRGSARPGLRRDRAAGQTRRGTEVDAWQQGGASVGAAVREAWVSDLAAALRQEDAGAYVNLLGDDGQARLCQVYPGRTLDRLPQPAGTGVDQDLVERIENELERTGVLGRPGRVDAMAFLDLVGYTRLTEDQGDAAAAAMAETLAMLVSRSTREHGGVPVKWLGDGVMG